MFERAWAWFELNKKQLLTGAVALLVVGLVVGLYVWRKSARELDASAALSRVEAQFALPGAARNDSADPYLKIANEHAGTGGGARALLQAGGVLFARGNYAEAQTQFQRFGRDYPDSPLRGQALLGNAACLDAMVKPDEAAEAYKRLVEQRPGETVVNQARFALARIHESQGRLEQARALYEEVARGEPGTSTGNEAGLKAEELRAKTAPPVLSPAAPATTPVVPVLDAPPLVPTNTP